MIIVKLTKFHKFQPIFNEFHLLFKSCTYRPKYIEFFSIVKYNKIVVFVGKYKIAI